jgi:glycosyltransferase involved in cell wall biosynthesis
MVSKTIIVLPAYRAEKTLEATLRSLPLCYEKIILCDDASNDRTVEISRKLNIETIIHEKNKGYGANQKTLYTKALEYHPDIIIMVHPDNQYDTSVVPQMIEKIQAGADFVMGSRIQAMTHGMPWWKYISNKTLTYIQNKIIGTYLTEFHSGLRAYKTSSLTQIPFMTFADGFVFDSEMILAFRKKGFRFDEVMTTCVYEKDSSSIGFWKSLTYGAQTLILFIKQLF